MTILTGDKKAYLKFKELTIPYKDEYIKYGDRIKNLKGAWWLKDPADAPGSVWAVTDGILYSEAVSMILNVRPVLIYEPSDQTDSTMTAAGYTWTILKNGMALCNEYIGQSCFRRKHYVNNATEYEYSDIKAYLNAWADENLIEA